MLRGYYFGDTESGLARRISPDLDSRPVLIPMGHTTRFLKKPPANMHPRLCHFEVDDWLADKPDMNPFQEANPHE